MAAHGRFDSAGAGSPQDLALLWHDLVAARAALAADRDAGHTSPANQHATSAELLHCLQAYVDGLTARRLPVPPGLRDELRLRHGLSRPER